MHSSRAIAKVKQESSRPIIPSAAYTVGGTVQAGGGVYIRRKADDELFDLCCAGAFAYVLSSRQVGKSSLMIETARRLKERLVQTIIINLTSIGTQLTAEQWYLGLLIQIEEQVILKTDVLAWWRQSTHLSPVQRLMQFFQKILLVETSQPVVIFIDEIDTTLTLSFTDDFYAAIRAVYNARAMDANLKRLSFVLVGVATPGDLIRDPRRTPFNIGQRVELTDFTLEEALPLAALLGLKARQSRQILETVLGWTGGHPYLTQRLLRVLAEQQRANWSEQDIDGVVNETFFGQMGERDSNLQFVRDMLTVRAPNKEEVLTIYQKILMHISSVEDEEQSTVLSHLKLSGVVCSDNRFLRVRNRIYRTVFNTAWICANMEAITRLNVLISESKALVLLSHTMYEKANTLRNSYLLTGTPKTMANQLDLKPLMASLDSVINELSDIINDNEEISLDENAASKVLQAIETIPLWNERAKSAIKLIDNMDTPNLSLESVKE